METVFRFVRKSVFLAAILMVGAAGLGGIHAHAAEAKQESLTGDVAAMWCYAFSGKSGIARTNLSGQANCIQNGSPIAIKVDEAFYIVQDTDNALRNKLMNLAGRRVAVEGKVDHTPGDQKIWISKIERARKER